MIRHLTILGSDLSWYYVHIVLTSLTIILLYWKEKVSLTKTATGPDSLTVSLFNRTLKFRDILLFSGKREVITEVTVTVLIVRIYLSGITTPLSFLTSMTFKFKTVIRVNS